MDQLTDYILWMGDLDFQALPFRDADALILCVISYFDLSPVTGANPQARVRDCLPMIEAGEARICITGGDMGNTAIFEAAARSKRFGDLLITDYEDILSPEEDLQFAAVTLRDEGRFLFIAYRGTDSTLTGWKEDFMISFTRTKAQNLAAEYAERVLTQASEPVRYIGGHSKGGNQALYAASLLDEALWDTVTKVYLLDGPGFCPEVLDTELVARVDPKAVKIIPEFDIIGKLFETPITETHIVASYRHGLTQHSLASWLIDHGRLAEVPEHDRLSLWVNETVDRWIAGISQEDRVIFIDELFDALRAGGKDSLDDMGAEDFYKAFVRLSQVSSVTKQALTELPKQALQVVGSILGLGRDARPPLEGEGEAAAEDAPALTEEPAEASGAEQQI